MTVPPVLETHMAIVGTTDADKTVARKGDVEQLLADGRQFIARGFGLEARLVSSRHGLVIVVTGSAIAAPAEYRASIGDRAELHRAVAYTHRRIVRRR